MPENRNKSPMLAACALTYAGLLPFLLLSVAVAAKIKGYDYDLALRAYGAVIISFLCGIHWATGLLFSDRAPRRLLVYSNAITLAAYGSLLFGLQRLGLVVESVCFGLLLKLDHDLLQRRVLPLWYFKLRCKVTPAVVVLLIGAAWLS